ncbi:MAG: aldo/keto reductase [Lentisphaerae bacterium]|nr:aldo/keto reductase [Lentisphaerota bacterium]MCP4103530.1 aldo/keto reductase [Lentisphaerota bacterium]
MKYKIYGKTEKKVSAIGMGGMRFNMEKPLQESAELLHYALEKGINYFDTAPQYHEGKSEEIFGIAFKQMPRDNFFVSTKLMPERITNADDAYEKVCLSLEKMHVDHIDFFHVWCIRKMEHYFDAMRQDGLYEALLRAKDEGLINHIVFSSHQQGDEVQKIIQSGVFEGVLLGVNILNFPYRWDGVLAAQHQGMGVVAMNPLAGGLIPQNEDKLRFLTSEGETPTEAALRFLVGCPEITVALNGFSCEEHIDMACEVAENARPFSEEELNRVKSNLTDSTINICTACGYCDTCPKDIPILKYMQLYNNRVLFDISEEKMIEDMAFQHEWGLLGEDNSWADACIACGRCERSCTQHLPIITRLKDIAKWEAASKKPLKV